MNQITNLIKSSNLKMLSNVASILPYMGLARSSFKSMRANDLEEYSPLFKHTAFKVRWKPWFLPLWIIRKESVETIVKQSCLTNDERNETIQQIIYARKGHGN